MKTIKTSNLKTSLRNIKAIVIGLSLVLLFACNHNKVTYDESLYTAVEWWKPILADHNITLAEYYIHQDVFVMGSSILNRDSLTTVTDATVIMRDQIEKGNYKIYSSPLFYHKVDSNKLVFKGNSSIQTYIFLKGADKLLERVGCTQLEVQYGSYTKNSITSTMDILNKENNLDSKI